MVEYALNEMAETLQLSLHSLSLSLPLRIGQAKQLEIKCPPMNESSSSSPLSLSRSTTIKSSTTLEFFSSPLLSSLRIDETGKSTTKELNLQM
jgi:hypothetical protein